MTSRTQARQREMRKANLKVVEARHNWHIRAICQEDRRQMSRDQASRDKAIEKEYTR